MRLPGWCERCHRFKQVRPSTAALARLSIAAPDGICADCEEAELRPRRCGIHGLDTRSGRCPRCDDEMRGRFRCLSCGQGVHWKGGPDRINGWRHDSGRDGHPPTPTPTRKENP